LSKKVTYDCELVFLNWGGPQVFRSWQNSLAHQLHVKQARAEERKWVVGELGATRRIGCERGAVLIAEH
jgi:hypothetical protein